MIGRHIDELEKALGTPLFTRSQHGLLPTDAAVELGPHVEAMAASAAALMRMASGASQEIGGTVRLSASRDGVRSLIVRAGDFFGPGMRFSRDMFALRVDNNLAQLAAIRAGHGIGVCQVPIARRDADLVRLLPRQ
jgi:DNA-binding transcriptional LysR family regulator